MLFSFSMIYFLNRNDEKWPYTRQTKIFGPNQILPSLGIENTLILVPRVCCKDTGFVKRFDYECSLFRG
jgi:hypothetical protein